VAGLIASWGWECGVPSGVTEVANPFDYGLGTVQGPRARTAAALSRAVQAGMGSYAINFKAFLLRDGAQVLGDM
jgi:hypothetical protein